MSFLIKLQASACNIIKKETVAQVFSCAFCEIFMNTSYFRTTSVAASRTWNNLCRLWNSNLMATKTTLLPPILFATNEIISMHDGDWGGNTKQGKCKEQILSDVRSILCNHTSALVFSCKFAAYFQNIFSEHL